MKKTLRMIGLLAALCLLMPACSNDDDDVTAVNAIVGNYTGTLGYSVMGYPGGDLEGEYTLAITKDAKEKDEVTVILPECSFKYPGSQGGPKTIPSVTVTGVDVKAKGNVYTIEDDDFTFTLDDVIYTGKINGTITGKNAVVEYDMQPGSMPMVIKFTFKGAVK